MYKKITLDKLRIGKSAKVLKITNLDNIKRRMLDMGLIEGTIITAELVSPFNDPKAYRIRNALIAIRNEDSKNIIVEELE